MARGFGSVEITTSPTLIVHIASGLSANDNIDYGVELFADSEAETRLFVSFDAAMTAAIGSGKWLLRPGGYLHIEAFWWSYFGRESKVWGRIEAATTNPIIVNYKAR